MVDALFGSLARHRGEWLAQGLLIRALTTEAACRGLVIERLGLRVDVDAVPDVDEEQVDDRTGWRVDVLAKRSGQREVRIELKLAASLTVRQIEALGRKHIDLFVVPESRKADASLGEVPRVTWAELARRALDTTLRTLLAEAESHTSWLQASVAARTLADDFEQLSSRRSSAVWPTLYRFLCTVDVLLRQQLQGYQPSTGWSLSPGQWYGYTFDVSPSPRRTRGYWIGLTRGKQGAAPTLGVYQGDRCMHAWPLRGELAASAIAADVIAHVGAAEAQGR
jgi:hypothetical protein